MEEERNKKSPEDIYSELVTTASTFLTFATGAFAVSSPDFVMSSQFRGVRDLLLDAVKEAKEQIKKDRDDWQ